MKRARNWPPPPISQVEPPWERLWERVMKRIEKRTKRGPWRPPGQPPVPKGVARIWEAQRFFSVPAPWLYKMPEELEALAARFHLSPETVAQMIEERKIPLRYRGRRSRKFCVLIQDVLEGIRGTGRGNGEDMP